LGDNDIKYSLCPQAAALTSTAHYDQAVQELVAELRTRLSKDITDAAIVSLADCLPDLAPANTPLHLLPRAQLVGPWTTPASSIYDVGFDRELVWAQLLDMCLHGDGGWVVDRLITPVFLVLAHEVRACDTRSRPRSIR
jgi:hypothetical protein